MEIIKNRQSKWTYFLGKVLSRLMSALTFFIIDAYFYYYLCFFFHFMRVENLSLVGELPPLSFSKKNRNENESLCKYTYKWYYRLRTLISSIFFPLIMLNHVVTMEIVAGYGRAYIHYFSSLLATVPLIVQ